MATRDQECDDDALKCMSCGKCLKNHCVCPAMYCLESKACNCPTLRRCKTCLGCRENLRHCRCDAHFDKMHRSLEAGAKSTDCKCPRTVPGPTISVNEHHLCQKSRFDWKIPVGNLNLMEQLEDEIPCDMVLY